VAERPKGMGRGLAAILAVGPRDEPEELRGLPLELIVPNPHQPRRHVDEAALLALADSIRARGVIQPVLVRPQPDGHYELVAGERRWRAARLAGLDTVPALVRHHDDAASLELALIENMAREDLNPVEEARACAALVEELELTREEVGLRVGRSRVAVSNLLRLLDLPDEALELLERGELTEGHGRALLVAPENARRRALAREAAAAGWSVRELERRARGGGAAGGVTAPGRAGSGRSPGAGGAGRGGEERAIDGSASGSRRLHPDRLAAIEQISDVLGEALGVDLDVQPAAAAGYRVQMTFGSLDEVLDLARRLRIQRAA
jgi:ParB family chromosome partitioning protein